MYLDVLQGVGEELGEGGVGGDGVEWGVVEGGLGEVLVELVVRGSG